MSCSHLHTASISPAACFGNTHRCMDCNLEFRLAGADDPTICLSKNALLAIAKDLRDGMATDYPRQRMDYAARRLEQMAEKLSVQWPQSNPWAAAIDEARIANCLDCTTPDTDPVAALAELIAWEIKEATDPLINGGYALVKQDDAAA